MSAAAAAAPWQASSSRPAGKQVLHEADARLLASRPDPASRNGQQTHLKPSVAASLKARLAKAELRRGEYLAVGAIAILAVVVRLWKVWEPSSVV